MYIIIKLHKEVFIMKKIIILTVCLLGLGIAPVNATSGGNKAVSFLSKLDTVIEKMESMFFKRAERLEIKAKERAKRDFDFLKNATNHSAEVVGGK